MRSSTRAASPSLGRYSDNENGNPRQAGRRARAWLQMLGQPPFRGVQAEGKHAIRRAGASGESGCSRLPAWGGNRIVKALRYVSWCSGRGNVSISDYQSQMRTFVVSSRRVARILPGDPVARVIIRDYGQSRIEGIPISFKKATALPQQHESDHA